LRSAWPSRTRRGTVPRRVRSGRRAMCEKGRRCTRHGRVVRCALTSLPLPSRHGSHAPLSASRGRHLPRHVAGREQGNDLRGRSRSVAVRLATRLRDGQVRLAAARLVPDGQPLPPDNRDCARSPLARHAPAQLSLRAGIQRAVRPRRASLPRPVRCVGHPRRRPSVQRVRVRPRQSDTGRALREPRGVAVARRRGARRGIGRARAPAPTSRAATRRRSDH
jgi:hypothetical protein